MEFLDFFQFWSFVFFSCVFFLKKNFQSPKFLVFDFYSRGSFAVFEFRTFWRFLFLMFWSFGVSQVPSCLIFGEFFFLNFFQFRIFGVSELWSFALRSFSGLAF